MLAGRPAFTGNTVVAILHATVYEQPPALTGSPAVASVDRVIRRALAKKAAERPATAEAMADELRDVPTGDDDTAALTHPMTRIVVLPFRMLRADPETDFLAFSLPDAITTSLAGIGSLVVRSSATAARFANETPDFKALAAEAGVDRVVSGTILRAGNELRAHVQLVEAPGGTVITSHSVQAPLGDLFQLQDDLARRVVEALALPLGGAHASPSPDAPASARAYELYLRGNEIGRGYSGAVQARDLYERSVALDPTLRAGLGAAGPVLSPDRQIHRGVAGQRRPGQAGLRARARTESEADDRAQVLRESRIRHRPCRSARSSACSTPPRGTATTRSCSRASCTRAGMPASTRNRWRHTPKHAGSIRTSTPASNRRSC